jgi:hypothetical protein
LTNSNKTYIVVIDQVRKDPENYSDIILGRPREEYCSWIAQKNSWGGAIGKCFRSYHKINLKY